MRRITRRGFTLIELMAALALSGLAIVGAARLLDQLGDARDRSAMRATRDAHNANGVRLLRALVLRAELQDESSRFFGSDTVASFPSSCEVPGGWLERCAVTLALASERDSAVLTASARGSTVIVWRGAAPAQLRYFSGISAPGGGRWLRGWGTSVAPPAAIGIATARDTLVLRLGSGT
jgi:prepilin-type N-terminal cleavage/methylation domain-containing protein